MIDKIANFVEEIRIQQQDKEAHVGEDRRLVRAKSVERTPERGQKRYPEEEDGVVTRDEIQETESAKSVAEKLIVEAEQYKAAIERPPGTSDFLSIEKQVSDESFFHQICHVDAGLRQKNRNGTVCGFRKIDSSR